MKALSIKQPWAWLIVNGYKDVENRTWASMFRGRIYIHAGKTFDEKGYKWIRETFPNMPLPSKEEFQFGGLIGTARLSDVVTESDSPWFEGNGLYGFVFEQPKTVKFRPYPGELKLFSIKD